MVKTKGKVKGIFNLQPYEIDYSLPAVQILKKLPEKFPAEVIDETLYVHEPPTLYHSRVNRDLLFDLVRYVKSNKLGEVFSEPTGVFFDDRKTVVMPDVFFVSKKKSHLLKREGLFGPPDLIIEVLSPGTSKYNFTTKKEMYERYGVDEYWLVDPETKDSCGFLLENGKYGEPLILKGKINIRILKTSIRF